MDLITVTNVGYIKETLQHQGVCVVPRELFLSNILDDSDCEDFFEAMIRDFEFRTSNLERPFIFDDETTWETLNLFEPLHNMLYKHWGIGQSQYLWDYIRTNQNIITCFEQIWDTEKLIVSFDGISMHLPGEISGKKHFFKKHWYHFDQSPLKPEFECVQGLINAFDTNEGDATLVVMQRSHHFFREFTRPLIDEYCTRTGNYDEKSLKKEFGENWVKVKDDDLNWFRNNGCEELRIVCPRGSLVLWDSRTLHYGSQPLKERENPNIRAAAYVCMVPAKKIEQYSFSHKTFIERSLNAVSNLRMTNHWPQFRKLIPFQPSSQFKGITEDPGFLYPEPPRITPLAYSLITGDYKS